MTRSDTTSKAQGDSLDQLSDDVVNIRVTVESIAQPMTPQQAADDSNKGGPGEPDDMAEDLGSESQAVLFEVEGNAFALLELADVPLKVWAAVVARWESDGQHGRWDGNAVQWAVRRTGQGNFPWIVAFWGDPDHVHCQTGLPHGHRLSHQVVRDEFDWAATRNAALRVRK